MAEPLATLDDLRARWPELPAGDEARAGVLLADASEVLRRAVPQLDELIGSGVYDARLAVMVVCAMVKRAMIAGDTPPGVEQSSTQAGPFAETYKYANPMGNLYLIAAERALFGPVGGRSGLVSVKLRRPCGVD